MKRDPALWRTNPATGRYTLAFDNLTKDEAGEMLMLLMRFQNARDPVPGIDPATGATIDAMVTERTINAAQ